MATNCASWAHSIRLACRPDFINSRPRPITQHRPFPVRSGVAGRPPREPSRRLLVHHETGTSAFPGAFLRGPTRGSAVRFYLAFPRTLEIRPSPPRFGAGNPSPGTESLTARSRHRTVACRGVDSRRFSILDRVRCLNDGARGLHARPFDRSFGIENGLARVRHGRLRSGRKLVDRQRSYRGALGDYLEQRTNQQLEASNGNLLLGGRPEWGAALALWQKNPLGFGFAVSPSSDDYWLAIRSMPMGSQARQENSIVALYFRQGQSISTRRCGLFGAFMVLREFSSRSLRLFTWCARQRLQLRRLLASPYALRGAPHVGSVWDILFSPTSVPQLAIALATALIIRGDQNAARIRTEDSTYETTPTH